MNPEDEKYAAQLLEKMKAQNAMMNPGGDTQGNPDQSPGGPIMGNVATPKSVDPNSQAIISSVQNSSPASPAQGAFANCPQCGSMHPPLRPGETCPMKKVEVIEAGISDDDINRFLSALKNISVSQIQSKGIKDGNKLFQHLTIELTKILEAYSE